MTVKLQYESRVPVAAQVTIDGRTHMVPIRKKLDGWESDTQGLPADTTTLYKLQLAIAAAVLGL